jgi:hypothetical protein
MDAKGEKAEKQMRKIGIGKDAKIAASARIKIESVDNRWAVMSVDGKEVDISGESWIDVAMKKENRGKGSCTSFTLQEGSGRNKWNDSESEPDSSSDSEMYSSSDSDIYFASLMDTYEQETRYNAKKEEKYKRDHTKEQEIKNTMRRGGTISAGKGQVVNISIDLSGLTISAMQKE